MKEKRTRKQTLDALEQCAKTIECAGCAYMDYITCKKALLRDVFKIVEQQEKKIEELEERIAIMCENSLLKEQEAVEPILIREGRNKNYNDYVCPRCGYEVAYEQNYCSECGVRFLWEGRWLAWRK